jgi:lipid II:glycine glycyltransferase (peptidoglycan interpeptide bridge formation enzyme)
VITSFFQTDAWAAFKQQSGWQPRRIGEYLALRKRLPFGLSLEYWPELPYSQEVLQIIKNECDRSTPDVFTRFEFLEKHSEEAAERLADIGLKKSFEEVQPEYRQWVYLDRSDDELLKAMKPKGRYNIKVAMRRQLEVRYSTDQLAIEQFFNLYQQTARRNRFQGRGFGYFKNLVELLAKEGVGEVIIISKDDKPLSAGIFLYWGGVGSYLYGASGGDRNLMAPYLMHWAAMKRSKEKGCRIYDLLAISPPDRQNHPYAKLTRFKTQFGGESVRLLGSWDFIRRPFWYNIYQFVERCRRQALR